MSIPSDRLSTGVFISSSQIVNLFDLLFERMEGRLQRIEIMDSKNIQGINAIKEQIERIKEGIYNDSLGWMDMCVFKDDLRFFRHLLPGKRLLRKSGPPDHPSLEFREIVKSRGISPVPTTSNSRNKTTTPAERARVASPEYMKHRYAKNKGPDGRKFLVEKEYEEIRIEDDEGFREEIEDKDILRQIDNLLIPASFKARPQDDLEVRFPKPRNTRAQDLQETATLWKKFKRDTSAGAFRADLRNKVRHIEVQDVDHSSNNANLIISKNKHQKSPPKIYSSPAKKDQFAQQSIHHYPTKIETFPNYSNSANKQRSKSRQNQNKLKGKDRSSSPTKKQNGKQSYLEINKNFSILSSEVTSVSPTTSNKLNKS